MINESFMEQAAQLAVEDESADDAQHAIKAMRAEIAALKEGTALLLKLQMEVAEKAILDARIQSHINKFA